MPATNSAKGANGPQKLAADTMAPSVSNTTFKPMKGKINTFLADSYILKTASVDAHNNVTNLTAGRLLASAIMA